MQKNNKTFTSKKTAIYKNPIPSEHVEQCLLVNWWNQIAPLKEIDYRLLFAIPNGEIRSKQAGARLKAEGVRAGVPDLFLAIPRQGFYGLFIEMKRQKGGALGKQQKIMLGVFKKAGYATQVCFGFEHGMQAICDYMGWTRHNSRGCWKSDRDKLDKPQPWLNWGD